MLARFLVALTVAALQWMALAEDHIPPRDPSFAKLVLEECPMKHFLPRQAPLDQAPPTLTDIIGEEPVVQPRSAEDQLIPVIIIPSLIGNRLMAELDLEHAAHWYCYKTRPWFTIYIDQHSLLPGFIDCWLQNMMLVYDNGTYAEPQGVTIGLENYGNISSANYLDSADSIGLWNVTTAALEKFGYVPGVSLRAAPYDWRVGPTAYPQQFAALKLLIEETYTLNNNTPVAFISLSMGGPYFLHFLNQQTQAWKDQYVYSFFSLSGVFAGSSFAISALISREPGLPSYFPWETMRTMFQTFGSITWLMPFTQGFGEDHVWVSTPERNYTGADFDELFLDAGYPSLADTINGMAAMRNNFSAPGVPTYCVIGYNLSTMDSLIWGPNQTFDDQFNATFSDGDQVVLSESLNCSQWAGQQSQPVVTYRFANMLHGAPQYNFEVIGLFLKSLGLFF